jgi:hypothetical protein
MTPDQVLASVMVVIDDLALLHIDHAVALSDPQDPAAAALMRTDLRTFWFAHRPAFVDDVRRAISAHAMH